MDHNAVTIAIEDAYAVPFFKKIPISIKRGKGVFVWDENGRRYLDFTSGWGVTCLGYSHPVITKAITRQTKKIIHNPNSGAVYSPYRAHLLELMQTILPGDLKRIFFNNSGAEANDAVIKLARKASGKLNIISTEKSFHGRTIGTASATGQASHREKFNPLMPNYIFVPYNDIEAVRNRINDNVAAVIVEPIQGEGGIIVPSSDYLIQLSELCHEHNVYLILDEIQTGIYRTGEPFYISHFPQVKPDFITMAKGLGGGFPISAFAMTEEVSSKLSLGDHGGSYCGNPLGCSIASAILTYIIDRDIGSYVKKIGQDTKDILNIWQEEYPNYIKEVRGTGLLLAVEFQTKEFTAMIQNECLKRGLILNVTQGNVIRVFPALNITEKEMAMGLDIMHDVIVKQIIK